MAERLPKNLTTEQQQELDSFTVNHEKWGFLNEGEELWCTEIPDNEDFVNIVRQLCSSKSLGFKILAHEDEIQSLAFNGTVVNRVKKGTLWVRIVHTNDEKGYDDYKQFCRELAHAESEYLERQRAINS